jgi:hypothetical protein
MHPTLTRLGAAASLLAACAAPSAALAEESPWSSFISVSPVFEEANLDGGGDVSIGGVILRAGTSRDLGGGNRAGITFNYDYFDYSFDNPAAFGGVAPWHIVQRYGFSVPTSFALRDGWSVGFTPSFDWFKENGASTSDSLVWGATVSAVKRFDDGNILGLGVAAFSRIEETSVFPFPIVDWRFGQRWRLINPLAAGPTGPAGLELDYEFDNGWKLGFGGAYRRTRFRLSESGPVPNGVGQVTGLPVFLRAARDFGKDLTLNLYGGVVAGGNMRVEDSSGNRVRDDDFSLAPFLGANLVARF